MNQEGARTSADTAARPRTDEGGEDSLSWAQLRHFLHAPLRRPVLVVVPWLAVVALSVAAVFVLPKRYMSSTLILVESEKVPESFIAKVATADRSQRLEAVKPEILSRTRLERVIEETRPYPEIESRTQAVEKLRKAIFINVTGNDGFTIEFSHHEPRKAQEVTDRLARLFIEETVKSREQQVEGAVDFLVAQVKESRTELENKDSAVRRYKEEHMGRLPEQLQTNLATMQMLQREMQTVEENLFFARDKQESLAREIGRSSAGATPAAALPGPASDASELRRQLAALRTKYTDDHPDVQGLRTRLARLEARATDGARVDADASDVTHGQLERANQEIRKLEDRQRDLERRTAEIRLNVEETPRTEQELATLMRDYQKLNENYVTLLSKQLEAQMSGRLEQRWKGEQFRMLDPASLPEKPVFPKAPIFIGLGLFFGLAVGLATALGAEYIDSTVKDSQGLQGVLGHPVLACIPHHAVLGASAHGRPLIDVTGRAVFPHRPPSTRTIVEEVVFHIGERAASRRAPILESLRDSGDPVGEELRLLAARLGDVRQRPATCIGVTSALPVEGKSTISVGLSGALAEDGRRILLIEADLRRPSLTPALGVPPAPGLSDWLEGLVEEVPVRYIEPGGFSLLTAGQTGLRRPEVLRSPRMQALLRGARAKYDLVILDAAPVLPVSDAVLMQDLLDGFLLVVRARQTPRDAIQDAVAKLRSATILGVVLNDHREYRGSYRDRAYRQMPSAFPRRLEDSHSRGARHG
jgi:succinoglycan biosynthesis transport protein ExoP